MTDCTRIQGAQLMAAGSKMHSVDFVFSRGCGAAGVLSVTSISWSRTGRRWFFLLFTAVSSLFSRFPDSNLPGTNMLFYWFQSISENAQVCCVTGFFPFSITEVNEIVRKEHQVKSSNVKTWGAQLVSHHDKCMICCLNHTCICRYW